jgi:hypothetical protein
MPKTKRIFNLKVRGTGEMLDLMKNLTRVRVDLEAESRPGSVRVVAHGTDEEIRKLELLIREFSIRKSM